MTGKRYTLKEIPHVECNCGSGKKIISDRILTKPLQATARVWVKEDKRKLDLWIREGGNDDMVKYYLGRIEIFEMFFNLKEVENDKMARD